MTDLTTLTTKTAQSLHAEWCRQMREKGWHWKDSPCRYCPDANPYGTNTIPNPCACSFYSTDLIPWPDLHGSRRQEYLSTAKAVLPEIVETIFTDAMDVVEKTKVAHEFHGSVFHEPSKNGKELVAALLYLRDRRLEELK